MLAMLAGFARRDSDLVSRFAYALPCVADLCRLARSGCCFCCASDDFVEPCLLLSRSACAASWCTGVLSASDCGGDFSRKIQFWFQKYLFLRVEMRSHFWLQFLKHLQYRIQLAFPFSGTHAAPISGFKKICAGANSRACKALAWLVSFWNVGFLVFSSVWHFEHSPELSAPLAWRGLCERRNNAIRNHYT